jgi:hypothetical protein
MGHPRQRPARPVADEADEASSTLVDELAEALETLAPLLEQFEAFERARRILVIAIRWLPEARKCQEKLERLTTAVPRLEQQVDELVAAREHVLNQLMDLERAGHPVKLPASITGQR